MTMELRVLTLRSRIKMYGPARLARHLAKTSTPIDRKTIWYFVAHGNCLLSNFVIMYDTMKELTSV